MTDKNQEKLDKPRDKMTDVEISKKLSISLCEDYRIALEFMETNPDYSLLKFRKSLKHIIDLISNKSGTELEYKSLNDSIKYLVGCGVIEHHLKLNLHKVRDLCNGGVHKGSKLNKEEFDEEINKLKKDALDVRNFFKEIFGSVYVLMNKGASSPKITFAPLGQQQYRETIYDALISTDFKQKLKAGIICEDILKAQFYSAPIIETNNIEFHLKGLRKNALAFYESAYKISAQVDNESYSSAKKKEEIIFEKCEIEPLYKYANLGLFIQADNKNYKKALKAAADRGYVPARALLGATFYKERKYELAFSYLSSVENKDEEGRALLYLFYYYNDGYAPCKTKPNKALKYLKRAIELDYPDALAILSGLYFKNKNYQEAEELLEKSIELGSVIGIQKLKKNLKK
jgi:hypothetical protein